MDSRPPMPDPISTPMRSELVSVTTNPESRIACMPATTPYCMKASIRRASLALMNGSRSRLRISPPKCVGKVDTSNRVTGPMPLRPPMIESQAAAISLPTGETIPKPVTTTRRLLNGTSSKACLNGGQAMRPAQWLTVYPDASRPREARRQPPSGLALVRIDVIDGLLNRRDLFRILVGNFGLEFLFECHHQLNRIQRVRAEIVDERGVIGDFFFFHAQLFGHDLLNLLLNSTHRYGVLSGKPVRENPFSGKILNTCRLS